MTWGIDQTPLLFSSEQAVSGTQVLNIQSSGAPGLIPAPLQVPLCFRGGHPGSLEEISPFIGKGPSRVHISVSWGPDPEDKGGEKLPSPNPGQASRNVAGFSNGETEL